MKRLVARLDATAFAATSPAGARPLRAPFESIFAVAPRARCAAPYARRVLAIDAPVLRRVGRVRSDGPVGPVGVFFATCESKVACQFQIFANNHKNYDVFRSWEYRNGV